MNISNWFYRQDLCRQIETFQYSVLNDIKGSMPFPTVLFHKEKNNHELYSLQEFTMQIKKGKMEKKF